MKRLSLFVETLNTTSYPLSDSDVRLLIAQPCSESFLIVSQLIIIRTLEGWKYSNPQLTAEETGAPNGK